MESANQFSLLPPGGLLPPKGLNTAMEGLVREVLLKNPKDIYAFAADYFEKLMVIRNMSSSAENEEINNVVYFHQFNENKKNINEENRSVSVTSQKSKTPELATHLKSEIENPPIVEEAYQSPELLQKSLEDLSQNEILKSNEETNSPDNQINLNVTTEVIESTENNNLNITNTTENINKNEDDSNCITHINDNEYKIDATNLEIIDSTNSDTCIVAEDNSVDIIQLQNLDKQELTHESVVTEEQTIINKPDETEKQDIIEEQNSCIEQGVVEEQEKGQEIAEHNVTNEEVIEESEKSEKLSLNVDSEDMHLEPANISFSEGDSSIDIMKEREVNTESGDLNILKNDSDILINEEEKNKSETDVNENKPATGDESVEDTNVIETSDTEKENVTEVLVDEIVIENKIEEPILDETIIAKSIIEVANIVEITDEKQIIEDLDIEKAIEPTIEEPVVEETSDETQNPEIVHEVEIEHLSTTLNDKESNVECAEIKLSEETQLDNNINDNEDNPNEYELKISLENKIPENNSSLEEKNNKINMDENLLLHKYVTTIQKVFRGFLIRRKTANLFKKKTNIKKAGDIENDLLGDVYNPEPNYGITHASIEPLLYTVPEEKNDSSSTEDESSTFSSAATKIQAGVRGFLTRKYFQQNKTNNSSDTTAPSIGEDSKSFEDLGSTLESDDTVSKIIVATSSLLIEQLEHFEKLENKASSKDTLDVSMENEEGSSRARKKLRREDAIQLNSPCSSEETPINKYSPAKTSEDEDPIGDLATSIITEIISNTYTPIGNDIKNETDSIKEDMVVDEEDLQKEVLSVDLELMKDEVEENRIEIPIPLDNNDIIDIPQEKQQIVHNESVQSDDCDVVSGPIILNKGTTDSELKSETNCEETPIDDVSEDPVKQDNIPDDFVNAPIASNAESVPDSTSDVTSEIEPIDKSSIDDDMTESKKPIKEIKGLLHSGEFHDTLVLPTKVVRQSSQKSKD